MSCLRTLWPMSCWMSGWVAIYLAIKKRLFSFFSVTVLLAGFCLGACSAAGGTVAVHITPTSQPKALAVLHWCGKPLLTFRDDASPLLSADAKVQPTVQATLGPANGTPSALTDWGLVKANLGFKVYLPSTLSGDACLMSVSSIVRHPILGSNFVITYIFANHDSLTISQVPLHGSSTAFQCSIATDGNVSSVTAKGTPTVAANSVQDSVQLCTGGRDTTNIIFSARGKTSALEQLFRALKPDVNWMPER